MEALKWQSLRTRRNDHIFKLVRKCLDGRCPQYFKNCFVFNKYICKSLKPAEEFITNSQEILNDEMMKPKPMNVEA